MMLLNSVLTILVLEKVGAVELAAEKPIMKAVDSLNTDKDIIVKISPDTIFKSFRAMVTSDYLQSLAKEFAQQAAAHFMTIIKESEENKFRQAKSPNKTKANLIITPVVKKKGKYLVNKEELLVLLRHPAIDGDNLEKALSDEISETTEGITVRLKINGAYYKRHNLAVTPDLSITEEPKTTKLIEALKTRTSTTEKPKWTTQIPTK